MEKDNFIKVNQILDTEPRWGIFTRTQIISSMVIIAIVYFGCGWLGIPIFLIISTVLVISWLILIGERPHEFLDLFVKPPGTDWYNGHLRYVSPSDSRYSKVTKLLPIAGETQSGKKQKFMAFQDYLHLNFIFTIRTENETICGYLLKAGKQYQIVWCFKSGGYHYALERRTAQEKVKAMRAAFKEIPMTEKLRIVWSKFSEEGKRVEQLNQLLKECDSSFVAILLKNEREQVKQLTELGLRQEIAKKIFCTWTTRDDLLVKRGDPLGNWLRIIRVRVQKFINWFAGSQHLIARDFFQDLLLTGYERSYLFWRSSLARIGWEISPMSERESWNYIYQKFNAANLEAPELSQKWVIDLNVGKIELQEIIAGPEDLRTILIEGNNVEDATPSHQGSTDSVYLPGLKKLVGILTLVKKPLGWESVLSQLEWCWSIFSKETIRDTEAIVEITTASDFLIEDNLRKLSKRALARQKRALKKGRADAKAVVDGDLSFEAQKQMYCGKKAIYTAMVLNVYRSTHEALHVACLHLANSLTVGKLIREKKIAWKIWLETLPITINTLLKSSSWLCDRRLVFDDETVPGVMPILVPRDLDRSGIEFLATGGKPIYLEPLADVVKRILIVGEPGSGKTALVFRVIVGAIAARVPVVGVDFNFGTNNSFSYACELLGRRAAKIDLSQTASNLLEWPDLRGYEAKEKRERFMPWFEQTRSTINGIVTWGETNSTLIQRAEALIVQALTVFFDNDDIIERYYKAFALGWRSLAWQNMPVLKDWLKFVSKEHLNLYNYSQIDEAAINLIHAQVNAFLITTVGKLIGKASSIPPDPLLKIFSFSPVGNKKEEYVLSNVALSACLRNTIVANKSLFIGDEIESLLKLKGFSQAIARICSTGRKNGMNVILITHGISCFYNNEVGQEILDSITHRLIGKVTPECAAFLVEKFPLIADLIGANTHKKYGDFAECYSQWLMILNQYAWQTKCYLAPMILGAIANNPPEVVQRNLIRKNYPNTLKGEMLALRDFSNLRFKQNLDNLALSKVESQQCQAIKKIPYEKKPH